MPLAIVSTLRIFHAIIVLLLSYTILVLDQEKAKGLYFQTSAQKVASLDGGQQIQCWKALIALNQVIVELSTPGHSAIKLRFR